MPIPAENAPARPPDRLSLARPDDWHVHLRDGAALAAVAGMTARVFARAIVMPNLAPPVVTTEQASAYRDRILAALPPRLGLPAADDALSHRRDRRRRNRPRQGVRHRPCGEVLPGRRDDEFRGRRHGARARVSRARRHGAPRRRAVGPRRSDGPRRRHLRPRAGFHRAPSHRDRARFPRAPRRAGARDHEGGRRLRRRGGRAHRRDDHPAASPLFAQCALRRRDAPAPVLHAGAEARDASAGARRGGDVGRRRSSSSAPIRRRTRSTARNRRAAAPAATRRPPRSSSTPRRSRTPARSTASKRSRVSSVPISTGFRATPNG